MGKTIFGTALLIGISSISAPCFAQISEVRVGISEFDEQTVNLNWGVKGGRENSVAVNAEILFDEPQILEWALSPQPYIGGSLNLGGKTSFAGAGLLWRQNVSNKFYGDFALGLAVHNGTTEIPLPTNITQVREYRHRENTEIEFGSRVLFRGQLAIGYRVNEDWAGEVFMEHLSNGNIFSKRANEGVDTLGFRVARRF